MVLDRSIGKGVVCSPGKLWQPSARYGSEPNSSVIPVDFSILAALTGFMTIRLMGVVMNPAANGLAHSHANFLQPNEISA